MIDPTSHQAIFLWRHADAAPISVDSPTDSERQLTALGIQQAQQMANWIIGQLPADIAVLSSPATRSLQTAKPLGKQVVIIDEFAPGASFIDILKGLHQALTSLTTSRNIVIVGHQPWIGQLANYLESHMSLSADHTISATDRIFKKAEVLCFRKPIGKPSSLFKLYQSHAPDNH